MIAVVGCGYWGKNLVRNFHQLGVLAAVCDRDSRVLDEARRHAVGVEMLTSFPEILERDSIQAVVIATPAETHFSLAKEALLANKHVFAEKPLVLVESEALELVRIANEGRLVLMVGHLLQYHPAFLKLKDLAASGDLGRINYIYSNRLNLGKFRREENSLWSFAPHDISMILALAGEEPETVFATGGNYLHKSIADVTTTHMGFRSGLKAHVFVSWLHPFKEQKLVLVGERKMAVFDDTQPWSGKLVLYPHEIQWRDQVPVPTKAEPQGVELKEEEPLRAECQHFLDCVRTGAMPRTDGREGLRVLRVLNAAQRSLDHSGWQNKVAGAKTPAAQGGPVPRLGKDVFVHETAIIDQDVEIGEGTKIWHFSHILSGSRIGANCNIGQNVVIGPDVRIGNRCKIQNNVSVYKGVTLEDGVFCGPSMVFTNVYKPRAEIPRMGQARPTLVKRGTTIGANATIVCGVVLGRYCFIGAGAVINENIQDHALVVGVPARPVGWVCECAERLSDDHACPECGISYTKTSDGMVRE